MKRSAMPPRRSPLRRLKELNKISPKQRRRDRVKAIEKQKIIDRDGARCFLAGVLDPCWGDLERHHLMKAWRGGPGIDSAENGVLLCSHHNTWIEDHPSQAKALGLVHQEIPAVAPTSPRSCP